MQKDPTSVVPQRILSAIINFVVLIIPASLLVLTNLKRVPFESNISINGRYYQSGNSTLASVVFYGGWFLNSVVLAGLAGGSIGKLVTGLRIVKTTGEKAGILQTFLRTLVGIVDFFLCGLIGLILTLATKGHRRLGDLAAGTLVVRKRDVGKVRFANGAVLAADPSSNFGAPGGDLGGGFGAPNPGWGAPAAGGPGWQAPGAAAAPSWGTPPAQAPQQGWQPPAVSGWQAPAQETAAPGAWQAPAQQAPAAGGWQAPAQPAAGGWQAPAQQASATPPSWGQPAAAEPAAAPSWGAPAADVGAATPNWSSPNPVADIAPSIGAAEATAVFSPVELSKPVAEPAVAPIAASVPAGPISPSAEVVSAASAAPGQPVWDASRGCYVIADPAAGGSWLQWDDSSKGWVALR